MNVTAMRGRGAAFALAAQAGPAADSAQAHMKAAAGGLQAAPKGAAFDRVNVADQVASHRKTLTDLRRFRTVAQGAALRTMIGGAIPQVRVRLERARQFRSSLGGA